MAQELKNEGNKLFQKRDYERALLKYEKAIKLLPKDHADEAYLRSNLAACYMQMGPSEYRRAIHECDLALEVSPNYTKALLKRARCYEFLNRLDFARRDVEKVLNLEPNNLTALEISERVKKSIEESGVELTDKIVVLPVIDDMAKEKPKKKKTQKLEGQNCKNGTEEERDEPMKAFKLVFGEDIRWAQIPTGCSLARLRGIVRSKYPGLKGILVKYRDNEGDLVTITTVEELRWAEESAGPQGSVRLYIVESNFENEPLFDETNNNGLGLDRNPSNGTNITENGNGNENVNTYIDEWIVEFARLFKNHVGVNSDSYLDLHELGMKLYSEAIEETVTCEEAQEIFKIAEGKFQEMTALGFFNWGNIHMSRARKQLFLSEEDSREKVINKVREAYEWAREEYTKAGKRYEEALRVKPDFYEGYLAICHQQFEQAKLCWYYALGSDFDLENWDYNEILELLDSAEGNIKKGIKIWEEMEEKRVRELFKSKSESKSKSEIQRRFELTADEAAELAANVRSQINVLWGAMLYERSVIEFKLGFPEQIWDEQSLVSAVGKFKDAGALVTDIAVIIKNHCGKETAREGLGFKIDEIIQAWNEMYDAKRWICGVPSFRLEPLFRRRAPQLHQTLEHI